MGRSSIGSNERTVELKIETSREISNKALHARRSGSFRVAVGWRERLRVGTGE